MEAEERSERHAGRPSNSARPGPGPIRSAGGHGQTQEPADCCLLARELHAEPQALATVRDRLVGAPASPWNESWNEHSEHSGQSGPSRAHALGIGAGRALMAGERPTCKRQGAGSNPATGSQVSAEFHALAGVRRGTKRSSVCPHGRGPGWSRRATDKRGSPPGQAALALITLTSAVRRYSGQPGLGAVARARGGYARHRP